MKVVLDIETIPCDESLRSFLPKTHPPPSLIAQRDDMSPEDWLAQQHQMTALDGTFGRIVCIGMIQLTHADEAKGACVLYGNHERALLATFWDRMRVWNAPYLITHNGLSFDLPFIWKRTVVHQVTPSMEFRLARFRTDAVFDTMAVWGNWDLRNAVSLDVLSKILGFEGKTGSGNQVFELWKAGKMKEIAEYCLQDTYLTYGCYCRMKFIQPIPSGALTPEYIEVAGGEH